MKLALISDIHGNYSALNVVLERIKMNGISQIICLGDVATLGPQPEQVTRKLREINCPCIQGNHDATLPDISEADRFQIADPLLPSLKWTLDRLDRQDLKFLKSFDKQKSVTLNSEHNLLCYHGSPESNITNILSQTPAVEIERLYSRYHENIMAGGHTHIQMIRQHNGRLIINPGSVGMPFKRILSNGETPQLLPFAEYATLEVEQDHVSVMLQRVNYDIKEHLQVIDQTDNPLNPWLIEQYRQYF